MSRVPLLLALVLLVGCAQKVLVVRSKEVPARPPDCALEYNEQLAYSEAHELIASYTIHLTYLASTTEEERRLTGAVGCKLGAEALSVSLPMNGQLSVAAFRKKPGALDLGARAVTRYGEPQLPLGATCQVRWAAQPAANAVAIASFRFVLDDPQQISEADRARLTRVACDLGGNLVVVTATQAADRYDPVRGRVHAGFLTAVAYRTAP